jgi:hypothetical protein
MTKNKLTTFYTSYWHESFTNALMPTEHEKKWTPRVRQIELLEIIKVNFIAPDALLHIFVFEFNSVVCFWSETVEKINELAENIKATSHCE